MENQNSSGKYFQIDGLAKTNWTWEEDKLFETALVTVPENIEGRWQKIAGAVPGRTVEEVMVRYQQLKDDLHLIESGQIELPNYAFDSYGNISIVRSDYDQSRSRKVEKKKGTPWTEEEHRNFLQGLLDYGKGDWRSISRNSVVTRTPTQVASHAQKYFLRQQSSITERKRSSIHDITTADTTNTMVVQTNTHGGDGGAGGGGAPPPQIVYTQYQNNFGYPN